METVGPGETITISQSGIPTGESVGVQVVKAATGSIAIGRSTVNVDERPAGSGNYVAILVAPVEADVYLIVFDWNNGVLTPTKSKVEEIQVSSTVAQADTGLGEVADYAKQALGGESFTLLMDSTNYGPTFISVAIEAVKARVMTGTLLTVDEGTLPRVVLSYLGKLVALELMPAVIDAWMVQVQSKAVGNDPTENINYPSREAMLGALRDNLLRQVRAEQALALTLIPDARLLAVSSGPSIDEDDDAIRVTADPRTFPRYQDYPCRQGSSPDWSLR